MPDERPELSEQGQAAVAAYGRVQELERAYDKALRDLEAARHELMAALKLTPTEDMGEYYRQTEALRNPPPVLEPTAVIAPPPAGPAAQGIPAPGDKAAARRRGGGGG